MRCMLPGQPSRTVLRPAIGRAAHQLLDRPRLLDDPIAVGLVPEAAAEVILAAGADHRALSSQRYRTLVALRSRFAEDRLAEAAARGAGQYVIVGAGLETFPWRQPAFARALRIFLLDQPATLAWTQDKFRARALATPPNLALVPIDLEECRLGDVLGVAGFDRKIPTFLSALGVVPYLSGSALDALFGFVASLARGSELVLSFVLPDDDLAGEDREEIRVSIARTDHMGEPWLTRVRPPDMIARLGGFGFSDIFHLEPSLAQRRYFVGRQDGLQAPWREQLIAAIV